MEDKKIMQIKESMPPEEILYDLSDLFKVCGDCTRIKILFTLFEQELCVTDIANLLEMNHSAISHQLKVLKQARLIKYKRNGKTMLYSMADNHVVNIFKQGLDHILE